jgi:hypothetical protein
MDLTDIKTLLQRIEAAIQNIQPKDQKSYLYENYYDGFTVRWRFANAISPQQITADVETAAVWLWSLKDYLKERLVATKGNPNDVESYVNGCRYLPLLADVVHLGTVSSSRRFKNEIKPMDKASEAILALKPVTFRYKRDLDPDGIPQFGLIAEQVEKVNPHLVARDADGKVYTVRYEAVNAMLLNEFLKEHRHVQEQDAIIARQQKQIEALTAGLQKVSAQIELSKPTPQTALNNH